MSLNRIAARMSAVQALKGKTLVGNNVLDSRIGALDLQADGSVRTDQEKPFISVYCDASSLAKTADQRLATISRLELRALVPNGLTDFLFEAGIAAAMIETSPETDESVVFEGIPATDTAFEFHLDIVLRQIGDALTDPMNEWADIFRSFCQSFRSVERARAEGARNMRLAAHQLKITTELMPDPVRGIELKSSHPLSRFFAKAAEITVANPSYDADGQESPATIPDPVVAAQVQLMQAQIVGDEHGWQTALRRYGLTIAEANALLILPTTEALIAEVNASTANISS